MNILMRTRSFILILLILLATLSLASEDATEEARFITEVTTACIRRNHYQFSGLYCEPSPKGESLLLFKESDVRFTGARLEPPAPDIFLSLDHQYVLLVCMEPPATKEMCALFPVVKKRNRLCIVRYFK